MVTGAAASCANGGGRGYLRRDGGFGREGEGKVHGEFIRLTLDACVCSTEEDVDHNDGNGGGGDPVPMRKTTTAAATPCTSA